ncbi:MAG: NAD(P)/FAD-dependent oxidoreductase, partial [Marmoricola sp.]
GFTDVTLLEAAPRLGGTWHYNRYPGAACDVPSHLYSYSYAQRASWSRFCSPQEEILGYLDDVAERYDVAKRVVTDARVTSCTWDDALRTWAVTSTDSYGAATERRAAAIVVATGQLNRPVMPRIEGLDDFAGHSFHTARWDHGYDLTGKKVAVIGNGASVVQLVPEIAERVDYLRVFQRTANWFLPRRSKPYSRPVAMLFRSVPVAHTVFRFVLTWYLELLTAGIRHPRTLGRLLRAWSTAFMRGQLKDPGVRRKAWPDYTFGCKRVLFTSAFLPALQRDNVELVTEPITRMTPAGPQTSDGRVHEVDCVIYGTGFKTQDFMFPMEITGAAGRSLRDEWSGGAKAHIGITVPGFPSMFVLYGPNTNTSGGSIIFFLEAQAGYVRQALELVRERGAAALDVREEVAVASDRAVQARFAGTAWTQCDSWYRNESGRIVSNWPGYMREYDADTRVVDPEDFTLVP